MKDLVIIGGGPGGYVAAIRAAQLGMQVTLVEKDELGGTCLNRGCIPTKAYYQNASVIRTIQQAGEFSLSVESLSFDMPGAYARKQDIVEGLVKGIVGLLKGHGVEVVKGEAQIAKPGLVTVGGQEIQTKRILIAAGSVSSRLPVPGANLPGVVTSDDLLEMKTVPKRMTVVGGGVIGLEFACIFNTFGSEVTVLEYQPEVLSVTDREISKRMRVYLKKQGITLHTRTALKSIVEQGDSLLLTSESQKVEISHEADVVLMATGRRACTTCVALDSVGIATDKGGYITVDENFETNVKGIYAIGDVTGGRMLAHVASEEGRVAVERMAGQQAEVAYHAVPSVIFTFPEIATVGLSEEEAKEVGISYRVGKFLFAANSKAVTMGETDGFVKVVADEAGTIIGVHIVGPHAADLIPAASVIVKNRLKTADVSTAIHPHPTLGEALLEAVMDVDRHAIHLAPKAKR